MASCFPIYTSPTGSKRNARESNAILGLNAHSSFNLTRRRGIKGTAQGGSIAMATIFEISAQLGTLEIRLASNCLRYKRWQNSV